MHELSEKEKTGSHPHAGLLKESEYTYDQKFKQLFQNRKFLVPILKNVVKEYRNLTLPEIEELIVSVTGDEEVAAGTGFEDVGRSGEMKTFYDVLIGCRLPGTESEIMVDLYFDLEMQREQHPGYPLPKRGIYYCSRLLSRQLAGTESADYGRLKPVYSVWIIINDIPKALQYSRYDVSLSGASSLRHAAGNYDRKRKAAYDRAVSTLDSQIDLIHLCLVFLAEDFSELDEDGDALIRYIQSVFIRKAANAACNPYADYSRTIQKEAESIMTIMDMFEARGEKRGTARGIIDTGRRHGFTDDTIIEDIAAQTGCSSQEAEKILFDYDHAASEDYSTAPL